MPIPIQGRAFGAETVESGWAPPGPGGPVRSVRPTGPGPRVPSGLSWACAALVAWSQLAWAAGPEAEEAPPEAEAAGAEQAGEASDVREIEALDQETLDRAEGLFFAGLEHYRKGRFEQAAVDFQKAYTLTRHRDLIYNIARSREQLGDKPGAVEWYRAYLATQPTDETAIIHRVTELGGVPTPAVGNTGVAVGPGGAKSVTGAVGGAAPVETVGAGVWPWVAAGVGVVAVGVGTVFGLQALDSAATARDATIRSKAQAAKEDAEGQALVADVALAVGGAAFVGAAVLWFLADQRVDSVGQVQVGLVPEGGATIGFGGRF